MNSPRRYFEPLRGEAILTIGVFGVALFTVWTAWASFSPVDVQPLLASLIIFGVSVPSLQNSLSVYAATTSPLASGRSPFASGKVGLSSVRLLGGPQVKKSETNFVFVVCTAADWPLLGAPHGTATALISGVPNVASFIQRTHVGANVTLSYATSSAS